MQPALERALLETEHLRSLPGRQPLDVAQHHRGAVVRRQPRERGLEAGAQLGLLGAVVRGRVAVGAIGQRLIVQGDLLPVGRRALGPALGLVDADAIQPG